jgi:hypothetical protein
MTHCFDIIKIFRWDNDNLLIKSDNLPTTMEDVVAKSNEMGVKTNKGKFAPFAIEQKFIGFIWNGAEKTVQLPNRKLFDRVSQLKMFLAQETFTYKDVEFLVGRLNHVSYILPQLRCYLCSLYQWMKGRKFYTSEQTLPQDVLANLNEWLHTLLTFTPTRLMPNPAPTEIGWVGDASTSFGIGILIGNQWSQFQLRHQFFDPDQEEVRIARLKTIVIRLGIGMLEVLGIRKGKTFIVWTDNTTTEGVVRKRKSKDETVNEEWKKIQAALVRLQMDIKARRVTSKENRANQLSRGDREGHKWKFNMPVPVPEDLDDLLFQVLYD